MGTKVRVDDRGRITIPNEERIRFGINDGDEIELLTEDDRIILIPIRKKVKKIQIGRKWGREAFFSAGNATFGE